MLAMRLAVQHNLYFYNTLMEKIREAFSGIEMHYSVEIPDPEIMYILNYF